MNLRAWMSQIDDNADVFGLNLIGTHDCVTQYVQLSHISRCQNMNIYEQLCIGVRALDIRVASKGDRLVMVHGMAKAYNKRCHLSRQMDMEDVLKHCYRFLDENPSEAIIFQFKNDNCAEMEKCFDIFYNTYICKDKERWLLASKSPSMAEARGKIVLLRRCKKENNKDYPLGTGIDFSGWIEQDDPIPDALALEADGMTFIIQDRYKYKPIPKWNECVKPFLDSMGEFDRKYVINYLSTAGGLKGPYLNSKYINPHFMEYELKSGVYYGMIYTDFPTPQMAEKIIMTNYDLYV